MTLTIPLGALAVLNALAAAGHEAYVVGGCVRDALLGKAPDDWDICTSALPEHTAACFAAKAVIPTGLAHGTVTVLVDRQPFEVTTFRVDGAYSDHRRPDEVIFVSDIHADLSRRDFTINAMAYHPAEGLVDPFGGQADLAAGVIRCVGAPAQRFAEDALRILRAVRFAATLGFSIEESTSFAAHAMAGDLRHVAAERVRAELDKLLGGQAAPAVLLAYPDVLSAAVPGLVQPERWAENVAVLTALPPAPPLRLAALLTGLRPDEARRVLNALKYDNATKARVLTALAAAEVSLAPERTLLLEALNRFGEGGIEDALALQRARATAAGSTESLLQLKQAAELLYALLARGACYSVAQLAITGNDLLALGVPPGKAVGAALQWLLGEVMAGRVANERPALLAAAQQRQVLS